MAYRLPVVWLWVRRVTLALTVPLWVPAVVFAFATELVFLPDEWRVRRRMRRAGRWIGWRDLLSQLRARTGTLIVERPLPSWSHSRVWWTPEVVPSPEMVPSPKPGPFLLWNDPLDREYHARFTDLERGRAQLIAVWCGGRIVSVLSRRFPSVPIIVYCSFLPPDSAAEPGTTPNHC